MIRAFAIRTASVLGVCFFDARVFVSVSAVGIMRNCMAAIEPCSTGCTFMGPVGVDLFLAIIDNALLPSSFDGPSKKVAACGWYHKNTGGAAKPHLLRRFLRNRAQ
jgi:hypothetical protein